MHKKRQTILQTEYKGREKLEIDKTHQIPESLNRPRPSHLPFFHSQSTVLPLQCYLHNTFNQNSCESQKQKASMTSVSWHRSNVKIHQRPLSRRIAGTGGESTKRARSCRGRDSDPLFIPFSAFPSLHAPSATSSIDEIDCGGCISKRGPTWGNNAARGQRWHAHPLPLLLSPLPLKRKGVRKHCYQQLLLRDSRPPFQPLPSLDPSASAPIAIAFKPTLTIHPHVLRSPKG